MSIFLFLWNSFWLNPLLLCMPQAYPVPCDPGQYALVGSLNCTDCPVGMKCPSTQQMPKILCAPGGLMSSYSFLVIFLKWCLFFALFIDKRKKGVNITFNPFHLTLCRLRTTCFDLIICPQLGTRVMTCLLLCGAVFKLLPIVIMQLLWFWFKLVSSLALKGMAIITQQIRGNQAIVVGFTSKSNGQVTSSEVLVLVCVQPSRFQSNWCDSCYFAPHWFVKISQLLCDYLCNCFGFGFVTAIWKLLYLSIPIQGYTWYPYLVCRHLCVHAVSLFSACQVFLKLLSHFIHFWTYSKYTSSCVHRDGGKGWQTNTFPSWKRRFHHLRFSQSTSLKIMFWSALFKVIQWIQNFPVFWQILQRVDPGHWVFHATFFLPIFFSVSFRCLL